jgi:uncharacterized membrane protein (DUF4010 family)
MEFVITIFSISLLGKLAIYFLGAHYGLLLTGWMGGFASGTATIHAMGTVAKTQPALAARAALGGVLSNMATLVQLVILLRLLAPQLLAVFIQPMCFGMVGMCAYALWVMVRDHAPSTEPAETASATVFDWQSLLTLTALVCGVSYASAALHVAYGQDGVWVGAAVSGLVDAHAIVPTLASLLTQGQLQPREALMPLLIAFSANTLTKSVLAFQSGGGSTHAKWPWVCGSRRRPFGWATRRWVSRCLSSCKHQSNSALVPSSWPTIYATSCHARKLDKACWAGFVCFP